MINEHLIKAIALSLSLLMVASALCLFGSNSIQLSLSGFDVRVHRVDAFFIAGLLIVCVNVYNFYKKIVCVLGETPNDALFSFIGMLIMFSLVIVMFFERVFELRFLFLTIYALGVVWKCRQIKRGLGQVRLAGRYEIWYRQARYSAASAAIAAVVFFVMFNPDANGRWLPILVDGSALRLSATYYEWAPLPFYIFFTLHAIRLFRADAGYMASDEFAEELEEARTMHAFSPAPPVPANLPM